MKKSLLVLLTVALIFVLTACAGQSEISVADAGYTCNAKVSYGSDINADVKLMVMGGGIFSLSLKTPKEFEGLTFNFDNDNMTLSYGNITADSINVSDSYYGFADLMNSIFLKLTSGNPTAVGSNGTYVYSGQCDLYRFSVTVNDDGFPVQIAVPEVDLTVTLSDWQY